MMNKIRFVPMIAAGVALTAAAWAQTPSSPALPNGVTRGASVEGITEYHLPNGLKVLLFPDPSKTTTTVNITYLVGSRNEDYGETGMAHLLEHMLFKGTPSHRNIPQELTEHGARPNGTTSYDRTNYFETFEGSDVNLNWALSLEADRMVNSFVAKKDLDSEMTVVRNEYEMGENNPMSILMERVLSTAYLWHNYGKSTIGARSDIENVPIERLQAFYHRFYQPDNAVLTVAGKVDETKTLALIAKSFDPVAKPTRVIQKTYTEEPVQDGERTVTLRRVGDAKVVIAGVHVPALSNTDGPLASIVGDVFANAPSGRLYKALVETKKAGAVFSDSMDAKEPGMLLLFAQAPASADVDDIQKILLSTMDGAEMNPPTAEEVNRSKGKFASQFDLLLHDSERVGLFLSEYIASGDWRLAFLSRDRLRDATVDDVDKFARTYLVTSNRTIGRFIPTAKPERAEIPPPPDVAKLADAYKGGDALSAGEAFDPSPVNVDKRTVRGQLQPGIQLALISKKTRGNIVRATMRLHFGNVENLRNKDAAGLMTGLMLTRGTAQHTRQQISDQFDKLHAQVRIVGQATGAVITVQTTRPNFEATMNLLGEVLRQPVFPENEFEAARQQELTMLETQRSEPSQIAFTHAEQHVHPYPKGDVRYTLSADEEIALLKDLKLSDVKQFYNDFYGASKAELATVGDFDPEALQKQVSTLFNGWTSKASYQRVPNDYKDVPAVNKTFETPDKANAFFVAMQTVKMNDKNADYPALTLANYMLGGGFLNSRLATRIRVKDGLSYGVGSQLAISTEDQDGLLLTYAISAPQNTAKVESDFLEEIKRAVGAGFADDEIAAAKSGWLQTRQVSRGQDAELAMKLTSNSFWNRTMDWDAQIDAKVKALTKEQVNVAMKKYVDPSKISFFKAGDFEKVKNAPPTRVPATGTPPTGQR